MNRNSKKRRRWKITFIDDSRWSEIAYNLWTNRCACNFWFSQGEEYWKNEKIRVSKTLSSKMA